VTQGFLGLAEARCPFFPMRIAVAGSQGQLGAELCRQLGADGVGFDLPEFDLTDRECVLTTLAGVEPHAIINAAAYTDVDGAECEAATCRAVNAGGVAHLVEACRRLDAVLVQVSTDYVFGADAARRTPYRENDAPRPQGIYAHTKLEGEQRAATWARHFIVRTCGLYGRGGRRSPGNFVDTMLRVAQMRRAVRVVGDQHCTPTWSRHLARAIRFLLTTDRYGVYHVVNSGATTWHAFAEEIFRATGQEVAVEPITTAEYGARAPRPAFSVLDTGKYHGLPGRPAMPAWQDALRAYLAERAAGGTRSSGRVTGDR